MRKTATLLFAGFSLIAGWIIGDEIRRRKTAENKAEELSQKMARHTQKQPPTEAQLKKIAMVVNDTHKRISAVSKALLKPAS